MAATPVASKVVACGQETGASAGGGQDLESVSTQLDRLSRLIRSKARIDVRTLASRHGDLILLLAITALAAFLRLYRLGDIPPGLHGDEAWTGLDARRVLNDGWIGPYVTSGLGQPSGPLYFAAPFVKFFGNTVFSIRLAMAVLGIATVPMAYITFRVMFDRPLAAFAALLLAMGMWHLHYSRIAFMVISWPLMELVTLLFLFLGIKTGRWVFYGLAGIALGAGSYTYNAYPILVVPLGLFLVWAAIQQRRRRLLVFGGHLALMVALAFFVALPLIRYAADSSNSYLNHHHTVSLLETEGWESGGVLDRADLMLDRAREFVSSAFWSGEPDAADGAGAKAMVDRVSLVLLLAGVGMCIWQWRRLSSVAVLLMVAFLPLGTIVTTQGTFRQTLGIVPFLAALAAAPLGAWWTRSGRLAPVWRRASYVGIALVVASIGYLNLSFYFGEYKDTDIARFTFTVEIAEASEYITSLPDDTYVYFYSGRWSYDYETRRYLASDYQGEDRSKEFGVLSIENDRPGSQPVVYVLLPDYLPLLGELRGRYPGGTLTEKQDSDGRALFSAYYLPSRQATAAP